MGVGGRGVPEPKVGVGAPRELGENRQEEEVFQDPLSRPAPLGRTGAEDSSLLLSEADQSGNGRTF